MPHMILKVEATRFTSREGNHPDDEAYIDQVKATLELKLAEMQFVRPKIELEFTSD